MAAHDGEAPFLGRTTKEYPLGMDSCWVRNDSRTNRFQRFLATAFPVFFGIVMPIRDG